MATKLFFCIKKYLLSIGLEHGSRKLEEHARFGIEPRKGSGIVDVF